VSKHITTFTFLAPGGVGSNILACMSDGRLAYIGKMISSFILLPSFLVLSYKYSDKNIKKVAGHGQNR
jgi:hypothetical protein